MKKVLAMMASGVLALSMVSGAYAANSNSTHNPNTGAMGTGSNSVQDQRHSDGAGPHAGQVGQDNRGNMGTDNTNRSGDQMNRGTNSGTSTQGTMQQNGNR